MAAPAPPQQGDRNGRPYHIRSSLAGDGSCGKVAELHRMEYMFRMRFVILEERYAMSEQDGVQTTLARPVIRIGRAGR